MGRLEALRRQPAARSVSRPNPQPGRSLGRGFEWWRAIPAWWQEWRRCRRPGPAAASRAAAISPWLATLPASPLVPFGSTPWVASNRPARGPGRPILVRARPAGGPWAVPSMDTLLGLGDGSAYLASLSAFLWACRLVGPVFFQPSGDAVGVRAAGPLSLREERPASAPRALPANCRELQPDSRPCSCSADGPASAMVAGWAGCAPVTAAPAPRRTAIPWSMVGARWLRTRRGCLELNRETPAAGGPAGTIWPPACSNLQAPLCAGGAPGWRPETALARIIALVEGSPGAQGADPGASPNRICRPFQRRWALLALAHVLSGGSGAPGWAQVLAAAAPGSLAAWRGHAVLGRWPGTAFFTGASTGRLPWLVVACPCALAWSTPTAITVDAWRLPLPACCSAGWRCDSR